MSTCLLQYSIEYPGSSPSTDWFCQLLFGCHKAELRWLAFVHAGFCQLSNNRSICDLKRTSIKIAFVLVEALSAAFASQTQQLSVSLLVHVS